MPKVSVCVPIYGVEKFIERCARSLFEQTLDDMEYIFVDDCTKDNSIAVLKKVIEYYPGRKDQIKIIHHEHNKGLSFARETAVNAATGDYIAHCDSDDWVETSMYQELYEYAVQGDYDFVKSGRLVSNGGEIIEEQLVFTEKGSVDKESIIRYLLLDKGWNSIWNTLIKRTVYEMAPLSYTKNVMMEDCYLVSQLILRSQSFCVVNKAYYYYYQNPDSISRVSDDASTIKKSIQANENVKDIIAFIHQVYGNQFRKEETALLFVPKRILIPIMNNKSSYKVWKTIMPGMTYRFLTSQYIPVTYKMWYLEAATGLRILLKNRGMLLLSCI